MTRFVPGSAVAGRPRLTSQNFPPYSYVAGHAPHPVTDPAGHLHGHTREKAPQLDPEHWRMSPGYCWGIDLFNHGYYWEAHEAWEDLWHAAGRTGHVANFLKGLIKLAASAVKAREGNPAGVARHARRAAELFQSTAGDVEQDQFAGLSLTMLQNMAGDLQSQAAEFASPCPDRLLTHVLGGRQQTDL